MVARRSPQAWPHYQGLETAMPLQEQLQQPLQPPQQLPRSQTRLRSLSGMGGYPTGGPRCRRPSSSFTGGLGGRQRLDCVHEKNLRSTTIITMFLPILPSSLLVPASRPKDEGRKGGIPMRTRTFLLLLSLPPSGLLNSRAISLRTTSGKCFSSRGGARAPRSRHHLIRPQQVQRRGGVSPPASTFLLSPKGLLK